MSSFSSGVDAVVLRLAARQEFEAFERKVGRGVAMPMRKVRPSKRGAGRVCKMISDLDAVRAVCLLGLSMSEVLRKYEWTELTQQRRAASGPAGCSGPHAGLRRIGRIDRKKIELHFHKGGGGSKVRKVFNPRPVLPLRHYSAAVNKYLRSNGLLPEGVTIGGARHSWEGGMKRAGYEMDDRGELMAHSRKARRGREVYGDGMG
ncbi:hypothetical protein [Pacificibacter marinus]|nr:hypothetical protein [Pacificibacter marinus]